MVGGLITLHGAKLAKLTVLPYWMYFTCTYTCGTDLLMTRKWIHIFPKTVPLNALQHLLTIQGNGVGIPQLLRCNIDLLISDRREEGNHVVVPVVTNWSHLIWIGGIRWAELPHPLVKNGIGESMEHLWGKQYTHSCDFKDNKCFVVS